METGLVKLDGQDCIVFKTKLQKKWFTYLWVQSIMKLHPDLQKQILGFAKDKRTFNISIPTDSIGFWGTSYLAAEALLVYEKYKDNPRVSKNVLLRQTLGVVLLSKWCEKNNLLATNMSISSIPQNSPQDLYLPVHSQNRGSYNVYIGSKEREKVLYFKVLCSNGMRYVLNIYYKDESDLFTGTYMNRVLNKAMSMGNEILSSQNSALRVASMHESVKTGVDGVLSKISVYYKQ